MTARGRGPAGLAAAADASGLEAVQRRTVRTLVGSQVLGGVGVASGIAVGSLVAEDVSGSTSLAGLAQTSTVLGAALAAVPMARLMGVRGRRPGLAAGYAVGALGAVLVVGGAVLGAFPLVLTGSLLFGASSATNLQARYAATDLAAAPARARALSTVVWATTVGAVLGPNLAGPGARVAAPLHVPALAGPYLFSIVAFLLAGLLIVLRLRPDPLLTARAAAGAEEDVRRRTSLRASWAVLRGLPMALLAVAAVVVSHTVMVAVMVMTPVQMRHGGDSLRVVGLVISGHVLGMYALSPLVGWLADRYGARRVVVAGQGVLLVACALAGSAHSVPVLAAGLFLLGVGWSFGLVAGSALLAASVPGPGRVTVQGLADLLMGVAGAAGGAVAGVVVAGPGFGWLTFGAAVLVLPVLAAAVVVRRGPLAAGAS